MMYFLLLLYTTAAATTEVTVHMNDDMTRNIGNSSTITCYYTTEILSVQIMVKYRNEVDFKSIVTSIPEHATFLSKYGEHLKNRSVLSNISRSSREVSITIENLTCYDDGLYVCNITYVMYVEGSQSDMRSKPVNLSTTVEPSDPEEILMYNLLSGKEIHLDTESVVEGENITFVCSGNVGRPPGKLVWHQFLDNKIVTNLTDNNVQLYELKDSCAYYQHSNVTIQVSSKDHHTKMRCSVYLSLSQQDIYIETREIDVLYKVKEPFISIEPFRYKYKEGTAQIKLTCNTDGNPPPQYLWYKMDNLTELFLSTNSTYIITNASVDESGLYFCKVNNSFLDQSYEAETTENIIIVKDDLNMSDWNPNSAFAKRDLIIGLAIPGISGTLIVVVLSFYKRKRLPKQNDSMNAVELPANQSCNPYYFSAYASVDIGFGDYFEKNNEMGTTNKTFSGESNSIQKHESDDVKSHVDTQTAPGKYEYASVNEATKMKNRITQNEGAFREDIHAKLDQNVYDVTHSNTVAKEACEGQQNQHIYDESYAGEYAVLQHNRPREPTTCNTIYDKAQVTSLPKEDNCD